jgi:hypothetical protein
MHVKPANLQLICRKMNRLITEYGVKEKYVMGEYKTLQSPWHALET